MRLFGRYDWSDREGKGFGTSGGGVRGFGGGLNFGLGSELVSGLTFASRSASASRSALSVACGDGNLDRDDLDEAHDLIPQNPAIFNSTCWLHMGLSDGSNAMAATF